VANDRRSGRPDKETQLAGLALGGPTEGRIRRSPLRASSLLLLGLAAGFACLGSDSPTRPEPPPIDPGTLLDCQQVSAALDLELAAIQACSRADECGQVLEGTSCGCTRDLVARRSSSIANFHVIVRRGQSLQCPATEFVTTCDCPAADGFACVDRRCTWNYR
jgi:hypothetical protein